MYVWETGEKNRTSEGSVGYEYTAHQENLWKMKYTINSNLNFMNWIKILQ